MLCRNIREYSIVNKKHVLYFYKIRFSRMAIMHKYILWQSSAYTIWNLHSMFFYLRSIYAKSTFLIFKKYYQWSVLNQIGSSLFFHSTEFEINSCSIEIIFWCSNKPSRLWFWIRCANTYYLHFETSVDNVLRT